MAGGRRTPEGRPRRGLVLSLAAVLVVIVGLCPVFALAQEVEPAGGEDPALSAQVDYPLWIGTLHASSTNHQGTGWKYDDSSKTLTLEDFNFDVSGTADRGVQYTGTYDLTIEIKGSNSIKAQLNGIHVSGASVVVEGDGTLAAEGTEDNSAGIHVENGTITIRGTTVTANGTNCGIFAGGGATIEGGSVTAVGSHDGSFGISVGGVFIIDGTTVTARGGKFGIVASNGTTTVKSGDVIAVGSDAKHESIGIMSIGGVVVNGGTISATGYANGINGIANVDADLAINGGVVVATATGAEGIGVLTRAKGLYVGKNVTSFTASGAGSAWAGENDAMVRNDVAGLGWSDVAGTMDRAEIPVADEGQNLSRFRNVQFPLPTHSVTVRADPTYGGAATASAKKVAEGRAVDLVATPEVGYEFAGWTVAGEGATIDDVSKPKATLTMGTADATVTATFRKVEPAPIPNASVTAHVQRMGWMAWAKNGESAGTQGMSRRAEAVQVVLVRKDAAAPAATYKGISRNYAKAFVKR